MPINNHTAAALALARIRVSDDLHSTIEYDAKGNPVVVIIAPLHVATDEEE